MLSERPDGVYFDMEREEYDAIDRAHWTGVKLLQASPAHYRNRELEKEDEDTDARKLGRVVHIASLEPEKFRRSVAVWKGARRDGKVWDAFREEHERPGREIIKAEDYEYVVAIQNAVRSHPIAGQYVSKGSAEVTVLWTHVVPAAGGIPERCVKMKSRLDFIADAGSLVDLKLARDGSPGGFAKSSWNFQYHVQAALYRSAYAAATGKLLPYRLVTVEPKRPHVVTVYRIPDQILGLGLAEANRLLEQLAYCRASNHWPPYSEEELELQLPPWVQRSEDEDVSGLGLEFAEQEA